MSFYGYCLFFFPHKSWVPKFTSRKTLDLVSYWISTRILDNKTQYIVIVLNI
ncbi:unnamed protein product [Schistosoma curassoni]|uniref:Uncharacterized protein n=1 Tax=Schistosoma curassoni TaxID=6186 RepID=A0A183K4H3_9TREM|nr:unnamed protein product [Schistosoma curassoni]